MLGECEAKKMPKHSYYRVCHLKHTRLSISNCDYLFHLPAGYFLRVSVQTLLIFAKFMRDYIDLRAHLYFSNILQSYVYVSQYLLHNLWKTFVWDIFLQKIAIMTFSYVECQTNSNHAFVPSVSLNPSQPLY